jgi:pimeloyl-ACP methyl ester carboxylesterase
MKRKIWILLGIINVFLILVLLIPYIFLSGNRQYQRVNIPVDGHQLNGYLDVGNKPQGNWIILAHGNRREGQSHELYRKIRENLPLEYSVLAIDFSGFGESSAEGTTQAEYSIYRIDDIVAAVEFLEKNYGVREDQIILMGHSFGAATVMKAAQSNKFLIALPIGFGDWDSMLSDPKLVLQYSRKLFRNTEIYLEPNRIKQEGVQFTIRALLSGCPQTPVWLIYASFDDGRKPVDQYFQEVQNRCMGDVQLSVIPLSDHMYGTESARLPKFIVNIRSNFFISFLVWRLEQILALY